MLSPRLYTRPDLAKIYRCSVATIKRWDQNGRFAKIRRLEESGGQTILYFADDIDQDLEERLTLSAAPAEQDSFVIFILEA